MSQRPQSEEKSLTEQIQSLNIQMEEFLAQKKACQQKVKELMAAEDPSRKIFHHQEIFNLKQDSLRLEVEVEFCRKKINRLNLGYES
ncbi:hypothetical protein [Desulfonatronovibrio magnus]|uniref:hypothetical protein n=1 Tax=Desulfonatronovibrio magnus TaxID=698827 RepID=UPI00069765D2|nr:hypothetical protein [Desulfonatronovibrio magnus]